MWNRARACRDSPVSEPPTNVRIIPVMGQNFKTGTTGGSPGDEERAGIQVGFALGRTSQMGDSTGRLVRAGWSGPSSPSRGSSRSEKKVPPALHWPPLTSFRNLCIVTVGPRYSRRVGGGSTLPAGSSEIGTGDGSADSGRRRDRSPAAERRDDDLLRTVSRLCNRMQRNATGAVLCITQGENGARRRRAGRRLGDSGSIVSSDRSLGAIQPYRQIATAVREPGRPVDRGRARATPCRKSGASGLQPGCSECCVPMHRNGAEGRKSGQGNRSTQRGMRDAVVFRVFPSRA